MDEELEKKRDWMFAYLVRKHAFDGLAAKVLGDFVDGVGNGVRLETKKNF